jgi:hypothetical protein
MTPSFLTLVDKIEQRAHDWIQGFIKVNNYETLNKYPDKIDEEIKKCKKAVNECLSIYRNKFIEQCEIEINDCLQEFMLDWDQIAIYGTYKENEAYEYPDWSVLPPKEQTSIKLTAQAEFEGLMAYLRKYTYFKAFEIEFSKAAITRREWSEFLAVLSENKELKVLSIKGNCFHDEYDEMEEIDLSPIAQLNHLEFLKLTMPYTLFRKEAKQVSKLLENSPVSELELNLNHISKEGFTDLIQSIMKMQNLKSLRLSCDYSEEEIHYFNETDILDRKERIDKETIEATKNLVEADGSKFEANAIEDGKAVTIVITKD